MAFSKSVVKAQDFLCCQLCESETKIKWKCLTCDLLICEKCCVKIHPKFHNAKNHHIIDIKEVGFFTEQDIDFTNIKCTGKQHSEKDCCMFCTTCDETVCLTCIAKTHLKHEFLEIKEVYQMKTKRLKKGQKKIENDKSKIKKGSQDLTVSQSIHNSMFDTALQDIQDHREALVKNVDEQIYKLKKEVEQKKKSVNDYFAKERNRAYRLIQTLEEENKKAEDIVKSKDASEFFNEVDDLVKSMERAVPLINIDDNSTIKFVPVGRNLSNIGLIQTVTSQNVIKFDMVKEFVTEVEIIERMVPQDDSLWISYSDQNILQKIRPDHHALKTMSTLNTEVPAFDMSITPTNDILVSLLESTLEWVNTNTGELIESLYNVEPLVTLAVHVTKDYNIIIGAMTPGPAFPVTGRRVVMAMDKNGVHQMVYEHDKDNKRLFTLPISITSTRNGTIAVVDTVSENTTERLVILGDKGRRINIYTGNTEINTKDEPFRPARIATTPADNILAIDRQNSLLHILDCDGQFITYINTKDKGIQYPLDLAYTNTGKFFIGCNTAEIDTQNAKLYEVVLSGC